MITTMKPAPKIVYCPKHGVRATDKNMNCPICEKVKKETKL